MEGCDERCGERVVVAVSYEGWKLVDGRVKDRESGMEVDCDIVYNLFNTRCSSKGNIVVTYCRTKVKSMSININGITLWNDFDQHIYEINYLVRFRNSILLNVH